jgi:hypothetical protein
LIVQDAFFGRFIECGVTSGLIQAGFLEETPLIPYNDPISKAIAFAKGG